MSSFGLELKTLITELAGDEFASRFGYQHVSSSEDPNTFETTQTVVNQSYVGAFSEPGMLKLFSQETLAQSQSAVIMPVDQFNGVEPKMFDKVQVSETKWLRVVGISEYLLPGGAGSDADSALPVSGGYALALAS